MCRILFASVILCAFVSAQFGAGGGGRFNNGGGNGHDGSTHIGRGGFGETGRGGRFDGGGGFGGPGGVGGRGGVGGEELLYEAKGRLLCGITGIDKVRIVLWGKEFGRENVVYDETQTDIIGNFRLRASVRSFGNSNLQPFMTIYHDCDDSATPGLRKMTVQLPGHYTNQGSLALKTFDIGTWNLETSFAGEEFDVVGREDRGHFGGNRNVFGRGGGSFIAQSTI